MPRDINDPTVKALLATQEQEGPPSPVSLVMYLRVFTSSCVRCDHQANTEVPNRSFEPETESEAAERECSEGLIAPRGFGPFSPPVLPRTLAATVSTLNDADVRQMVDLINQRLNGNTKVAVYHDFASLPEDIKQRAKEAGLTPDQFGGMISRDSETLFVVQGNHESLAELEATISDPQIALHNQTLLAQVVAGCHIGSLSHRNKIMTKTSRAAQIAVMAGARLKALGQLHEKRPEKQQVERETPEQLVKRKALRAKLKSFVE